MSYYADSKTATKIISCEGPTTEGRTVAACKSTSHADTAGNDVYTIDGYDTKNILICNKDDGCVFSLSLANETQPSHYVYLNANFNSSTNNKQVIICKEGVGCLEYKTNSTSTDYRYYINAGSKTRSSLEDTLIECKDTCQVLPAHDSEIYVNEFDTSKTIQCYQNKGCVSVDSKASETKNEIFLNSSDLNSDNERALEKDLIKCVNTEGIIECEAENGVANEVYINSHNTTELIICTSEGCETMASEADTTSPEYYINADPTDGDPLSGDLIKCKKTGSKINCEVTNGKNGDVFLNANADRDSDKKPLIVCSEDEATADSLPVYYVNSGNVSPSNLQEALIKCTYEK
ncbi:hypothetical protein PIROE2DRAFT_1502 [Piromyces sp. E2]|nr:hypothetical protein PIROE2DRAFT_1502 [Piromyces sp. E2]|eukprot:OUM70362.1 hypothetical protein PIROE2DRAFT_1502 [Piromyces sp. E2]